MRTPIRLIRAVCMGSLRCGLCAREPTMRRILIVALIVTFATVHARADNVPGVTAADRAEIERVISMQIEAFRRHDGDTAFSFASPAIREMFGDTPHFMAMVRRGYQPVYRPRSFAFDGLVQMDGRIVQRVEVIGPDGTGALALYTMERELDGSWKIAGCELTESERVGA